MKILFAQRKAVKTQVVLLQCRHLLEFRRILLLAALELFSYLIVSNLPLLLYIVSPCRMPWLCNIRTRAYLHFSQHQLRHTHDRRGYHWSKESLFILLFFLFSMIYISIIFSKISSFDTNWKNFNIISRSMK